MGTKYQGHHLTFVSESYMFLILNTSSKAIGRVEPKFYVELPTVGTNMFKSSRSHDYYNLHVHIR